MQRGRRQFVILLLVAAFLPSTAVAAPPSLLLEHALTATTVEADNRVLDYTLSVTLTDAMPIGGLTLSLVPLALPTTEEVVLVAGDLVAGATVAIPFRLVTPAAAAEGEVDATRLSWSGTCRDGYGTETEFPADSRLVEGDRP